MSATPRVQWEPNYCSVFSIKLKKDRAVVPPERMPRISDAGDCQTRCKVMCQQRRRASDMRTIATLLRHAVSNTTAHGFAHLKATHVGFVRVFWVACLLSCWAFFTFQVRTLVLTYHSTPVTTVVHPRGVSFIVPDITVCNPLPISVTHTSVAFQPNESRPEILTTQQRYAVFLDKAMKIHPVGTKGYANLAFNGATQTFSRQYWSKHLGHQKQDMIVEVVLNGVAKNYTLFELVAHHEFLNCYRLRLSDENNFQPPIGKLALYLYTDAQTRNIFVVNDKSGLPPSVLAFNGVIQYDKSASMIVFFTPKNYYPGLGASHIFVSAGQLTDIKIKMSQLALMDRNSFPCVEEPPQLELYDQINQKKVSYHHADDQCLADEMAKSAVAECGCYPSYIPMLYKYRNTAYCYDMNLLLDGKETQDTYVERISRFQNYSRRLPNLIKSFLRNCEALRPCHYAGYRVETSFSRWPAPGLYRFLLEKMKTEMAIRDASDTPVHAWKETFMVEKSPTDLDIFLKHNLVKLIISPGETASSYTKEEFSYKIENLLSDIGGQMGLLLGISVMSIIEIVSLVMEITATLSKTH